MRGISALLAALVCLPCVRVADCGESSAQLMVSVNVVASCRFSVDTASLSFGDVPQGSDVAARAEVGVTCSGGQPYAIGFDYGQHARGRERRMSSGASEVEYQLYADASRRQPLGPRGSGSELRGTGNGDQQRLPVYSSLTVGADTPPGAYTDVVRMTVVW